MWSVQCILSDFYVCLVSAPGGNEFEQQSATSRPDTEPRCEKNCTCVCHLQRPGMKLVWVRISEKEREEEEEELRQTEGNMVDEEESESESESNDYEAELDLYRSASSESDYSQSESQHANKTRFKATLNIIERQLRRKSDPGPEAVLHSFNSLPQCPPHLTKTHSASEEESIYEATIDLIAPPKKTNGNQTNRSPPAVPPRVPLDKSKGRCIPRRVALCPLSGASQNPRKPSVDLGSGDHLHPVRPPPPPPPTRSNARRLSNLSQTCQGD